MTEYNLDNGTGMERLLNGVIRIEIIFLHQCGLDLTRSNNELQPPHFDVLISRQQASKQDSLAGFQIVDNLFLNSSFVSVTCRMHEKTTNTKAIATNRAGPMATTS